MLHRLCVFCYQTDDGDRDRETERNCTCVAVLAKAGLPLSSITLCPLPFSQNLSLSLEFEIFGQADSQQTLVILLSLSHTVLGLQKLQRSCLTCYLGAGIKLRSDDCTASTLNNRAISLSLFVLFCWRVYVYSVCICMRAYVLVWVWMWVCMCHGVNGMISGPRFMSDLTFHLV